MLVSFTPTTMPMPFSAEAIIGNKYAIFIESVQPRIAHNVCIKEWKVVSVARKIVEIAETTIAGVRSPSQLYIRSRVSSLQRRTTNVPKKMVCPQSLGTFEIVPLPKGTIPATMLGAGVGNQHVTRTVWIMERLQT